MLDNFNNSDSNQRVFLLLLEYVHAFRYKGILNLNTIKISI